MILNNGERCRIIVNIGDVYREIARMYGVSVEEVKKDMQEAINLAYDKDNKSYIERTLQDNIPSKGRTPTTVEFIHYVSEQIKNM